jgi:hypothetical protein
MLSSCHFLTGLMHCVSGGDDVEVEPAGAVCLLFCGLEGGILLSLGASPGFFGPCTKLRRAFTMNEIMNGS